MDKDDLIVDLLNEVRSEQKSHSIILVKMKQDVSQNKDDLKEHMAQTRAVKSLVLTHKQESDRRLEKLEEPQKAFGVLKKYLIGLGAVSGAVIGILKAFNYL